METQTVEPAIVPAEPELNLLLDWQHERYGPRWSVIFAASLAFHLFLFFIAIQLPAFVRPTSPERTVIVRRIPLYLPPDVLTQKAPNRQKPSKQIDLADLLARPTAQPRTPAPRQSTRRFEMPKQVLPEVARNAPPQITAAPPDVALNQPQPAAPPPPTPSQNPFQNVDTQPVPKTPPKLAPPKPTVQSTIDTLARNPNNGKVVVSDDNPSEPSPASPGSMGRMPTPHASVELQSDPQGADFKPYLARILSIVRSNWRTVIPESVRMGTRRGRTVIEFAINRDGSIPKLVIADPSGSEPLDRAAVAGLSMSNPLPPLPSDYKGLQVRLAFSFAYNMPAQ